ncbi:MAG: hypothetical protein IPH44_11300 [Myxococcales bacterium]|nr:hypothetical protein [Myxococcales bacterium]MBK7196127.1 hypothetical protein [Myxococcales bacterium]MBP6847574.1 hypothetical protein [Kofleriaceae bacterium]
MRARLLGAVVALAVIAIAVIWWRGGSSSSSAPAGPAGSAAPRAGAKPPAGRPPVGKVEVPGEGPAAPGDVARGVAPDRGTRTYVMDNGAVVQDHRGDAYGPPIDPPGMPPSKRTMDSAVTAKVYLQLKPLVAACAGKFDPADRGDDPFVYVTMTVAVAKGTLTPTDVYPTLHDLKGASADRFTDCLRTKAMAIQVPDSGEPDRTDYIVQYPIRLK